jgi:DNA mismatch endonuclease (patch repair protein)
MSERSVPTSAMNLTSKSRQMARVRTKDTAPEMVVRRTMHRHGLRFRLHTQALPGRPDIVLPKHHLAVFVHGCYWHGCAMCDRGIRRPKTNANFWSAKLAENRARDARKSEALKRLGWRVAIVWECETRDAALLAQALDGLALPVQFKTP